MIRGTTVYVKKNKKYQKKAKEKTKASAKRMVRLLRSLKRRKK
jgi:hypothetical protein